MSNFRIHEPHGVPLSLPLESTMPSTWEQFNLDTGQPQSQLFDNNVTQNPFGHPLPFADLSFDLPPSTYAPMGDPVPQPEAASWNDMASAVPLPASPKQCEDSTSAPSHSSSFQGQTARGMIKKPSMIPPLGLRGQGRCDNHTFSNSAPHEMSATVRSDQALLLQSSAQQQHPIMHAGYYGSDPLSFPFIQDVPTALGVDHNAESHNDGYVLVENCSVAEPTTSQLQENDSASQYQDSGPQQNDLQSDSIYHAGHIPFKAPNVFTPMNWSGLVNDGSHHTLESNASSIGEANNLLTPPALTPPLSWLTQDFDPRRTSVTSDLAHNVEDLQLQAQSGSGINHANRVGSGNAVPSRSSRASVQHEALSSLAARRRRDQPSLLRPEGTRSSSYSGPLSATSPSIRNNPLGAVSNANLRRIHSQGQTSNSHFRIHKPSKPSLAPLSPHNFRSNFEKQQYNSNSHQTLRNSSLSDESSPSSPLSVMHSSTTNGASAHRAVSDYQNEFHVGKAVRTSAAWLSSSAAESQSSGVAERVGSTMASTNNPSHMLDNIATNRSIHRPALVISPYDQIQNTMAHPPQSAPPHRTHFFESSSPTSFSNTQHRSNSTSHSPIRWTESHEKSVNVVTHPADRPNRPHNLFRAQFVPNFQYTITPKEKSGIDSQISPTRSNQDVDNVKDESAQYQPNCRQNYPIHYLQSAYEDSPSHATMASEERLSSNHLFASNSPVALSAFARDGRDLSSNQQPKSSAFGKHGNHGNNAATHPTTTTHVDYHISTGPQPQLSSRFDNVQFEHVSFQRFHDQEQDRARERAINKT